MNDKGFTLIELIVIIVILGILAVTAIPKYVDMKTEAEVAAADGVFGAAQGAATMNFAASLLDKAAADRPAHGAAPCDTGLVANAQCLANAMEEVPADWAVETTSATCEVDAIASGEAAGGCIYKDADGSGGINSGDYVIAVQTVEAAGPPAVKAKLKKSW
ncbi:MAG: prepilin-type cleavage/methylation domain-containing protein [Desulfobulbaceae bacterium]|nr:MAG: prepilin-type cleavage/methylation domain-containing protein [Desulfobulbaceae bacterium]